MKHQVIDNAKTYIFAYNVRKNKINQETLKLYNLFQEYNWL